MALQNSNETLFKEQQRFKQWWLWLILLAVNGLFIFGFFKQVIGGHPFGDKPMSNTGLIIATSITFLLSLLFLNFRLDTKITNDGIYVRFFPIHIRLKFYSWDQLNQSYIRQYSALTEYGGWGFRIGLGKSGNAFTVSVNKGLQLKFKDNKKLLIGTNKSDQLREILIKIGQLKMIVT